GFTACNSTSSTKESIPLTAKCTTPAYQVLQSGDVISKPETLHDDATTNEPEVEIIHTEDGLKKVCIKSGTAVILR
ncbi:MAG: hypothetical protein QM493_07620, partial [Sulfurovum sp.]